MAVYYLGDYAPNQVIDFMWSSNNSLGAAANPTSAGTIFVYKNNSTTSTATGVTHTTPFNSITGIHHVRVSSASSAAFYATGNDFHVVMSGASIDGQFVNAHLAQFSIGNRHVSKATYAELSAAPSATGPTVPEMLQWNYSLSRNTVTHTATQAVLKQTDGSTSVATSTTTDNGTTYSAGAWV